MQAPETLNQLLERAASFTAAGLRFLDRRERETWASWADVLAGARRTAAALRGTGVTHGQRVALVYPTGLDFFFAFFGVLLAGAVPVPLYPPVRLGRRDDYHRRTAALLRSAGARLLLADRRLDRMLETAVAAAEVEAGCRTLADLGAAAASTPAAGETTAGETMADVGPEDLAMVQFSSGTTFDPKPIALTHGALVAQARILNGFWPDTGEVRHSGVSWLPLYHDMGLIGGVFPALERPGVTTLLSPEHFVTRPASWLRALSRYRATISAAPSFAYRLAAERIRDEELEGVDLGAWRIALAGAEPVVPATLRRFRERFAPWGFRREALTPVYGLAEASLAVTFCDLDREFGTRRFDREELARGRVRPDPDGIELASLGRPVPGFDVRIAAEDGGPAEPRRMGRVHVRGPTLMKGYLGQPEATARAFRDGWLDTGDLGFLFSGELYLTGRSKDVVILRGRNHSPHEIEQAVDGLPGVRCDSAVAASYLPEGAEGEVLLLFVERTAGDDRHEDIPGACIEAVLGATGLSVDRVHVLERGVLPRTSSGKLRRGETLRRHLAGELAGVPPVPAARSTA